MDVTFLESDTLYSPSVSNSSLQGEIQDEEQNWIRFDWQGFNDTYMVVNRELDITPNAPPEDDITLRATSTPPEAELKSPHSSVLEEPSPENIPEVNSPIAPPTTNDKDTSAGYILLFRNNRGKPPNRYSQEIEEQRSKYPIANYVSTKGLSEPLKTFAHELSSCLVPTSVQEALTDPKWISAIKEEMEALLKNKTWDLFPLPEGKKMVG